MFRVEVAMGVKGVLPFRHVSGTVIDVGPMSPDAFFGGFPCTLSELRVNAVGEHQRKFSRPVLQLHGAGLAG